MKITRLMGEMISAYSIALTRAVSIGLLIDIRMECLHDIQVCYQKGLITLEQADTMMDYFIAIAEEEEARIENNK